MRALVICVFPASLRTHFTILSAKMAQDESNGDITSVMIMEAIHGIKTDVRMLKEEVSGLKEEVSGLKEEVSGLKKEVSGTKGDMAAMEVRLTKSIVNESDSLAKVMVPSNKQLAAEMAVIKKHVGLAH